MLQKYSGNVHENFGGYFFLEHAHGQKLTAERIELHIGLVVQ